MSVKVKICVWCEILHCSISQASRRVKWTINLSPSKFETVNICFISLLHKFHNKISLLTLKWHLLQMFVFSARNAVVWSSYLILVISESWPCAHKLFENVIAFALKICFQTEAVMVKMKQVNRPINCLEFI